MPTISADGYPSLVEHAEQRPLPPDPTEKSDLILDGPERLRDAG